jgi:hypothetical protein
MRGFCFVLGALTAGVAYTAAGPAVAQNVKVTPLGSHNG